MPNSPGSAILEALYHRDSARAQQLAAASDALSVWEAAALGRDEALAPLLARDPALANAPAPDGFPPLTLAAFFAPVSTVACLLAAGADVGAASRNDMQVQPLHAAVASRNIDSMRLLLAAGADPNARQQVGYTPLMGAAGGGREDILDLLLAGGADPGAVAEDGKTAAAIAGEHGHQDLARRLASLAGTRITPASEG
jgi:uncharacterized protein